MSHKVGALSEEISEVRLQLKIKAGSPTLIEGTQPATSRPPFSATADPENRGDSGASADEGGLSAGAGTGGEKWPADRHNERASLARMALERGIYAGSEELNFND
jgi:hypothetical protein